MNLVENIRKSVDSLGQVELSGIKLETADPKLLDVGELDLNRHVAMQPAAIAYFGALKRDAERRLSMLKRSLDRWEKKKWALAKAAVLSGTASTHKPTVADIESRFITDNELEMEKWDSKIDKAQEEFDTLDCWYDAWRQKSFSLREHVSMDGDEKFTSVPSIDVPVKSIAAKADEKVRENLPTSHILDNVKGIISRRREAAEAS